MDASIDAVAVDLAWPLLTSGSIPRLDEYGSEATLAMTSSLLDRMRAWRRQENKTPEPTTIAALTESLSDMSRDDPTTEALVQELAQHVPAAGNRYYQGAKVYHTEIHSNTGAIHIGDSHD